MNDTLIRKALDGQRFETARRLAQAALDARPDPGIAKALRLVLHEALRALGDITDARAVLEALAPGDEEDRLRVALLLGEDYHRLSAYDFYRISEEKERGLTGDEYAGKYSALAEREFRKAILLADTQPRRKWVVQVLRACDRGDLAEGLDTPAAPASLPSASGTSVAGRGVLCGRLAYPDGQPIKDAVVTLGFPQVIVHARPEGHLGRGIGGGIGAHFEGRQECRETRTDASGAYRFDELPAQAYAFLAVRLDPAQYDVALRFVGRDIVVAADGETRRDAVVQEWCSAPAARLSDPFGEQAVVAGVALRKAQSLALRNPFHFDFPRQFVRLARPAGCASACWVALDSSAPGTPVPVQPLADGTLGCFLDLPGRTDRVVALCEVDAASLPWQPAVLAPRAEPDARFAVVETGRAAFRIPAGDEADALPPLVAVKGEDGVWRGQGRLVVPAGHAITRRRTVVLESGPLALSVAVTYDLACGNRLCFMLTFHRDEPYMLVRETTVPIEGLAFEFSLREFHGGRGFLHWTPEHGNLHWRTLGSQNVELARLQESVAWWIPPQGFGYAMTPEGLEQKDYIGVFTRRRGEWIDRAFERLAQGPGDDNRELDWPYPEMVGSTISMITARTTADGDAFFRFGGFDGERQWGLLVSTLERSDGPHKEISVVQHKVSSPRLEDYLRWRLHDPDTVQRPCVLVTRDEVRSLRARKASEAFAPVWDSVVHDHDRGPARGLRALVDSDPALAWRLAREMEIEAPLRARMTLLGRDYADVYNPVGGRGITPFAEQYDLIAATGVFAPEQEREIRATLLLMGHMFMEEDFMNWRFNSRNANFEADRTDIVGAVGLAFRGNPDADAMVRHASALMERSLEVYCTPGSGKWYENPACYYIHAASCRLNLAFHLHKHGILDVTRIERLKDFLRWGPLLLTARYPHDYALMRDGCSYAEYDRAGKVRRIPPIGDHANIGQWVSEVFALLGKAYQRRDPALADFLRWAYQEGGSNGGQVSKFPLFFAAMEDAELLPAPPQVLASRRLEGFGAVFRGKFGAADEFYLLFKQGPGGYRYHRTEGSFLLMAHGRPLVWDGGEAGETWRHSTLSFHDTHMPLAPGRVERFRSFACLDFVQGVHPKALDPGEPVFLSDVCDHTLVDVAWQRFREPNPQVLRSVLWVKDDYVLVSDDLCLRPGTVTHWHLQVVGDTHAGSACDPVRGIRFQGRFGVDLQVLLPGLPANASESVTQLPTVEYNLKPGQCFAMRHLQISLTSPSRLDAVLRPLAPGQLPLCSAVFDGGIHVTGDGIDDTHFLSRVSRETVFGDVRFSGRYGAVLRRPGKVTLVLVDGAELRWGSQRLADPGERVVEVCGAKAVHGDGGTVKRFMKAGKIG